MASLPWKPSRLISVINCDVDAAPPIPAAPKCAPGTRDNANDERSPTVAINSAVSRELHCLESLVPKPKDCPVTASFLLLSVTFIFLDSVLPCGPSTLPY